MEWGGVDASTLKSLIMESHLYFLVGILGVVAHTLLKYQGLRTDARKANTTLTLMQFLADDWVGILLAVLPVIVWLFTFAEAANKYPALRDYIRISFFMVGMAGSYALQLINSKSKKKIREVIDEKTDIADSKD